MKYYSNIFNNIIYMYIVIKCMCTCLIFCINKIEVCVVFKYKVGGVSFCLNIVLVQMLNVFKKQSL